MDKSQEYIVMCEKATEIQGGWQRIFSDYRNLEIPLQEKTPGTTNRDFVALKGTTIVTFIHNFDTKFDVPIIKLYGEPKRVEARLLIWLPRQDQLQEMVDQGDDNPYYTADLFFRWYQHHCGEEESVFASWEQFWLSIAMETEFNKSWNWKYKDWEAIHAGSTNHCK